MHPMRARQRVLAFLLGHHRSWLAGQTFQEHGHGIVFQDYLETVWTAQDRRHVLVKKISAMVAVWSLGPLVEALRGLRGVDLVSAATFIASTGDLSRFQSPASLDGLSVSFPLSIPAAGRSVEVASPGLATVRLGGCKLKQHGAISIRLALRRTGPRYSYACPKDLRHCLEGTEQVVCPLRSLIARTGRLYLAIGQEKRVIRTIQGAFKLT